MSVEPGFGGQSFMPSALDKLTKLRLECERQGLQIELEVDGGINAETAPLAVKAGATVLVAGSFVFSRICGFKLQRN
jgi:ribulose-phosphate 3-epimerase